MKPRSREIARGVAEIREDRARCSRRVAVWSLSATPRPVLGEMSACALIKARDYAGLECYVAARADVSAADHSGTVPSEYLASSRVISRHLASCRCTLRHHAAARCSRGRRRARDGERAAAGGRQAEVTRDDRDDSSLGDAAVGGRQPRGHRQVGPHAMARGERRGGGRRKGGGRRGRADPWRRGAARRPRRCGDHAAAARAAAAGRAHQLGGTAALAAHGGVGAVRCRAVMQRRWRGAKGRRDCFQTRSDWFCNSFSGGRSTGRRGRSGGGGGGGVASELARIHDERPLFTQNPDYHLSRLTVHFPRKRNLKRRPTEEQKKSSPDDGDKDSTEPWHSMQEAMGFTEVERPAWLPWNWPSSLLLGTRLATPFLARGGCAAAPL